MRGPECLALLCIMCYGCGSEERETVQTGSFRSDAGHLLTEELRIDGVEFDLVPINSIAVAKDGTIAVEQRQDYAIRFFSATGEPLGKLGREGQGPGEFTSLNRLGWIADTLWVYDARQQRVTLVSPGRELARTILVPRQTQPAAVRGSRFPEFPLLIPLALYSDETILALAPQQEPTYARVNRDGVVQSIVLQLPAHEDPSSVRTASGGTINTSPFPWPTRPVWAISADGSRLVIATAATEGPDAGTFSVLALDEKGHTVFLRRYAFEIQRVAKASADSAIEARAKFYEKHSPALATTIRKGARVPEIYRPITNVVVGRDATVWLQLHDNPESHRYLTLDPTGAPIGTFMLPRNTVISVADRENLWTLERDADDVQSIVRYRIASHARGDSPVH